MKFYQTSFFCDKGEGFAVNIKKSGQYYPFTVTINSTGFKHSNPALHFHLESEVDLINFKNSVIEQYETYLRSKEVKDV